MAQSTTEGEVMLDRFSYLDKVVTTSWGVRLVLSYDLVGNLIGVREVERSSWS